MQLKVGGPDTPVAAVQSAQLRNSSPGEYVIKQFDTQPGVPGLAGVVAAGSPVTFTLWMRKTDNFGTLYPRAKLHLNSASGTALCSATGASALTTTVAQYTLNCTTIAAITMAAADRFFLWTGVDMTAGPGNKSLTAELDVEGTLNGNYDSRVIVPLPVPAPSISSLTPDSGTIGTSVTISGSGFGSTQGASTVKFNGALATSASWSDSAISAPVPFGTTTGPVMATVNGVQSNGVTFTASVGTVSGTISRATDGALFSGALVEAVQADIVKLSATSGAGGAYTLAGLATGTYDIRASLPRYAVALNPGTSVTAGSTTSVNLSLSPGAPVSYVYDELGRLTAVIDPSSDSAKYTYDAVGNLVSINRQSVSQVSVLEVNPDRGYPAATIRIFGTGFSSTASENTVQFNGTPSVVTSANSTEIVTTVPSGSSTGPITVSTPSGSAAGPVFTIPSDISGSIVPGGAPVTITIPTPGQSGSLSFTGASGQRVSLAAGESSIAECDVSIRDPQNSTISGPVYVTTRTAGFLDAVTLGAAGTYSVYVDPRSNYSGSIKLALYNVVDVVSSITPGSAVNVTTTTPGQNARLTFAGTAGQKVSVVVDNVTVPLSNVSLQKPDGTDLIPPTAMDIKGTFLDATILPADGTYTILVDPSDSYTGSARVTLYQVVDLTSAVVPGGPMVTFDFSTPGQNGTWTFNGTAGQRVSYYTEIRVWGIHARGSADVTLLKPDGAVLTTGRVSVEILEVPDS
ncbi:MAG: IPT/TIG domain-containing protein [Acidobacteria bacterium]|nr:IPT/TIG domain-containing protein [Acidobacteriota bacterium]